MCGIAGILGFDGAPVAIEDVRAMCTAMTHRGPDDEGIYIGQQVGLGMRRLSIIDLAGGHQPISNEDNTIQAVLNGEIYNYQSLRRDLEARGHVFKTNSDTETIVHLYEEKGDKCVDDLRGMFAFAIWDTKQRRLLVARDRLGIKPLYYLHTGKRLLFASELKCLLALPEVERRVNVASLDHLLTHLYTPPAESIIAGVHKLEPGHTLTAGPGRAVIVSRYWQVEFSPQSGRSAASWEEELRAQLDESVRLHMVSDVPVGAFLSGGLDSSSVVATMARQSTRPVKTFSIGFHEKRFNELEYAREVARKFNTEHYELVLEPTSLSVIEDIAWHLDEPFGDSSAIPMYLVSQLAAKEVKVVLSGDGGDELFGGYDRYLVEQRERGRNFPPWMRTLMQAISSRMPHGTMGKRWLHHHSLPASERYLDANGLFNAGERSGLLAPGLLHPVAAERGRGHANGAPLHWLSELQRLDIENYLPLDILTKVDRMSMAHSIEARVPLLDHKFVEFAATVPPELLIANGSGKAIFKRAMRGTLPDIVMDRPKRGFAIPLGKWFQGHLGEFVRDTLLSDKARQRGFFNQAAVEKLVGQPDNREELGLQVWTLLSVELWCRAFLDRAPRKERARPRQNQDGQSCAASAS